MEFPIFNTRILSKGKTYDLTDASQRYSYFHDKAGAEIEAIKEYLETNAFVGFLLAKKQAGKGTYSKMLQEVLGEDRLAHVSVGDIVRDVDLATKDASYRTELEIYMQKHYRGFVSLDQAFDAFYSRSQDKLLPTEFVLTLVKREIEKVGRKALFIDGIPRDLDQISYSLFFRELINFKNDPDFFVLIDTPEELISARLSGRRVCPICKTSKNIYFNPTTRVVFNKETHSYVLICDNKDCSGYKTAECVLKEGDSAGISLIRARLESDGQLMEKVGTLAGVPKINLRTSIPVEKKEANMEDYEIAPEFVYSGEDPVQISSRPFIFRDDFGVESHSLMAASVVLSLIYQIHAVLNLQQPAN